jgi:hypothetical protein
MAFAADAGGAMEKVGECGLMSLRDGWCQDGRIVGDDE